MISEIKLDDKNPCPGQVALAIRLEVSSYKSY